MQIVGIINLSPDSFSDGASADPIARGEQLLKDGAHWLDLGAEASNLASARIDAATEIARLTPVVQHFAGKAKLSIDTQKPEVFAAMHALGATMWNDIDALQADGALDVARATGAQIVLMFRRTPNDAPVLPEIEAFFQARIAAVTAAGIASSQLILDPGLGNFLSQKPAASIEVLQHLGELRRFDLPLYICASRKSFLGALTGGKPPLARGPATLAAELFAIEQGVAFIRTHDVAALRDAFTLWRALNDD